MTPDRFTRYRCTPRGFLCRAYTLMQRRVRGKDRSDAKGQPILTRIEFYSFSLSDPQFILLFNRWCAALGTSSHRLRKVVALRPTPDRRDGLRGYAADNIQWLTYSENSAKR